MRAIMGPKQLSFANYIETRKLLDITDCPLVHLVQCGEAVHVGGVYVGAPRDEVLHLVPVTGGAGGQEHTAVTEPDPPLLALQVPRLTSRLTVLPPLELLRPLHEGGVGPGLERHDQRNITITWTQHSSLLGLRLRQSQARHTNDRLGCSECSQAWLRLAVNGSKREGCVCVKGAVTVTDSLPVLTAVLLSECWRRAPVLSPLTAHLLPGQETD